MTLLKKEVAFSHKALLNNFVPINFWRQSKTSNVLWSTFEELSSIFRSSRSQMFYKIVVLENFAKLTGKHLSWSVFLIKLKAFNFNKKTLQHRCFPVNFAKFLRTPCSQKTLPDDYSCIFIIIVFIYMCGEYTSKKVGEVIFFKWGLNHIHAISGWDLFMQYKHFKKFTRQWKHITTISKTMKTLFFLFFNHVIKNL